MRVKGTSWSGTSRNYGAGKEILIGAPESSDICKQEMPKFATVKRRSN